MAARKILITPRSLTQEPHPEVEGLKARGFEIVYATPGQTPGEAELCRLLPGCVGWLAGVEPVTPAVIAAATDLRVISRNGVGTDNLPMGPIRERGIRVTTTEGANARGVAELAIGLMFAALRGIACADQGIKAGGWPRRRGLEIDGRTVGVVGCGAIGRETIRMALGLGARVVGHDPRRPGLDVPADRFQYLELPELLAAADVVSLHCPPPADQRPLLTDALLRLLRPEAVLLNTARAGLVDEVALLDALDQGRLFAYGTDVFPQEPPRDRTLACHPRVVATSHLGGFTTESVDRATRFACRNLLEHLPMAEPSRA